MDIEILKLTEDGKLTVNDLLTKLEELSDKMDRSNQKFDIHAVDLAYKLYRTWLYGGLPIETWEQVARYNIAATKISYAGHSVNIMQADTAQKLNPILTENLNEYYENYNNKKEAWQVEIASNFENGFRKK